MRDIQDVLVIGGGATGLSAALSLGRARRAVTVIDAGQPRNAPAEGVHGLLGNEGISPARLLERGREEVRGYGVELVTGEVIAASRRDDGFEAELADGRRFRARRLLITTGLIDELPPVEGLSRRWGRDVVHCPYCHGWEIQDLPIGVLSTGPMSVYQANLFRQWSDDIVLFTHNGPSLTDEQREELDARGIRVVSGEVEALEISDDRLVGLRMVGGEVVARRALALASRMRAGAGFWSSLGLRTTEHPAGIGEYLATETGGRTEVPGVWAAGNVTDIAATVSVAIGAGTTVAGQLNSDLIAEETAEAVSAHRVAAVG